MKTAYKSVLAIFGGALILCAMKAHAASGPAVSFTTLSKKVTYAESESSSRIAHKVGVLQKTIYLD